MIQQIISILKHKGYKLYNNPYQLNIVGIRSNSTNANRFDDMLFVFFKDERLRWNYAKYNITTDPGTYWLEHPMQVNGTAILKEGQYVDAYSLGLHKGQYKALIQAKPLTVLRDYDRNALLDFLNGQEQTGYFGIDIHRANVTGTTTSVDKWSAGCQVFQNAEDFAQFMALCEKHKSYYGNHFAYTLIDYRAIERQNRRWLCYGIGGATLLVGGIVTWVLLNE